MFVLKSYRARFSKFMARKLTGVDLDQLQSKNKELVSSLVGTELKLNTLWAAGLRVYHSHSAKHTSKEGTEWKDLREALSNVKSL